MGEGWPPPRTRTAQPCKITSPGTGSKGPLSRPVGRRGLQKASGFRFKSPFASAEQPHHGALSHPPLQLVCTAGIPVSSYHVPRHTQLCPSAKPHTWNCFHLPRLMGLPFPKGSGTSLLWIPSNLSPLPPFSGTVSSTVASEERRKAWGCSRLACSPGPTNIGEGRTFPVSFHLPLSFGLCRGLR